MAMHQEFEQMITNNQGRIQYIASRYCYHGESDDMYQEIMLQLWRSFSSFRGDSEQSTWVYKVALNTAYTFVRKTVSDKKARQSALAMPVNDTQPAQESCQADILNRFMKSLNDTDASILMMYLDGLSSQDTVEVVGISANAVRARVKRVKIEFENQFIGDKS